MILTQLDHSLKPHSSTIGFLATKLDFRSHFKGWMKGWIDNHVLSNKFLLLGLPSGVSRFVEFGSMAIDGTEYINERYLKKTQM